MIINVIFYECFIIFSYSPEELCAKYDLKTEKKDDDWSSFSYDHKYGLWIIAKEQHKNWWILPNVLKKVNKNFFHFTVLKPLYYYYYYSL